MKKLIIYLSVIILLFGGLYAINIAANGSSDNPYGIREGKLSPMTREQLNDPNYQNIIKPEELETKLDDNYTGFIYFFSSSCIHCKNTTPLLKPLVDELGVDLPMFNLQEFTEGWTDYRIQSTPTTVYFRDGAEVDRLVGGMELEAGDGGIPRDVYKQFFEQYK